MATPGTRDSTGRDEQSIALLYYPDLSAYIGL